MTTMFADVEKELGSKPAKTRAARDAGTDKLFYADDTLLISSSAKITNIMLEVIMKHSEKYGMALNLGKCEVIAVNKRKKDTIKFPDGTPLKKCKTATYLGGMLRTDGAAKPEVENRLNKASLVFRRLWPLWQDAACSERWKLRVHQTQSMQCSGVRSTHIRPRHNADDKRTGK